ncbi:MAG: hypothetical protein HFG39_04710 [Lachnospiraceae bacterium]|nr:hypothetical protein [Lachnospiraceae bacterium]
MAKMKFVLVVKEGSYGPEFKVDGEGRLYAESRKDYSLLVGFFLNFGYDR